MNNQTFLKMIFGELASEAHVTDFFEDPNDIPSDRRGICWGGKRNKDYTFREGTNQYFTVSLFHQHENGKPYRRKNLFRQTNVVVLDDVKEKLTLSEVKKLPTPTYIMETSRGSEQWGYLLTNPCTSMDMVDNLIDGLIKKGLSPDGNDPGMKGVTRYVRLPDGYNTKASKLVDGKPFKCKLIHAYPWLAVDIEEIAKPLNIDLYAFRSSTRLEGATELLDHPILQAKGVNVKKVLSPGKYDITCPWVNLHTGNVDNGSAIFTNEDGTIGFECHHGHCQERTKVDLVDYLEKENPGLRHELKKYEMFKLLGSIPETPKTSEENPYDLLILELRKEIPGSPRARELAKEILKNLNGIDEIDRIHYHQEIRDVMGWTKPDFTKILKSLKHEWEKTPDNDFYDDFIYIKNQDIFYSYRAQMYLSPVAFQNSFLHIDEEAKVKALKGKVEKVDKMSFHPKLPRVYSRAGVTYGNTWDPSEEKEGKPGDCSPWLNHFEVLGWKEHRDHILKFMAYTILKPEVKINHIILLGGMEGVGKDLLLSPLKYAMGKTAQEIEGRALAENFNSYLVNKKYLHINETELGDHRSAQEIYNKLKPLAASPPETIYVNPKGIQAYDIPNIVNITMATNSHVPIRLNGPSRRFFALWSDLCIRDEDGIGAEWQEYFDRLWEWFNSGGMDHCVWYLRHNVDISKFNPKAHPPVTDFLRSIQEDSKSPGQVTLEKLIQSKFGCFASDLVTLDDIVKTISVAQFTGPDANAAHYFNQTKIAKLLREVSYCTRLTGTNPLNARVRIWCVRNKETYKNYPSKKLYDSYLEQITGTGHFASKFNDLSLL